MCQVLSYIKKNSIITLNGLWKVIKETFRSFFEEKSLFHGAALAYYTVFALVPLLYLSISYIGRIIGQDVMLRIIEDLLQNQVGISDVKGIMDFVGQLNFEKGNILFEVISFVVLAIASSAFIVCLRHSINDFYDLKINYSSRKRKLFKNLIFRAVSLAIVVVSVVLIIVIYFAQTIILSFSSDYLSTVEWIDFLFSNFLRHSLTYSSNAILFFIILKFVNDGAVYWKIAVLGALITALLLYIGQLLIKYYLFHIFYGGKSGGFAGTFFVLLAFVYYSSQIIFLGAKFTAVYARHVGRPIHFRE
jgi:membrane protein